MAAVAEVVNRDELWPSPMGDRGRLQNVDGRNLSSVTSFIDLSSRAACPAGRSVALGAAQHCFQQCQADDRSNKMHVIGQMMVTTRHKMIWTPRKVKKDPPRLRRILPCSSSRVLQA